MPTRGIPVVEGILFVDGSVLLQKIGEKVATTDGGNSSLVSDLPK
jgi:hypothetical protein